ncbi:MAG: hypothetical protein KBF48_12980 [Xanthomonadales bacterium]|nr:hypothetical protein [Xanthomonadales bacterium]
MIRLRNLSELYPLISASAPGYNETSAIRELRMALRKICQEGHVSQDTVETSLSIGDRSIYVSSPNAAHLVVHRVLSITKPTGDIRIVALDDLNKIEGWRTATGDPTMATTETPGELVLNRAPTVAITPIYVRVTTIPTLTSTKIDEDVMNRHGEAVADGALARILRIPGKPWTNPNAAMAAEQRFNVAISRARSGSAKNNAFTSIRTPIKRQC